MSRENIPIEQKVSELDDQRRVLRDDLQDWKDAGGHPQDVVDAVEALIDAKIGQRQTLPLSNFGLPHRMIDKGSLEMPTGSCPGKTRGNLGANSPVQRLPDELEQWERCTRYGRADLTLHPLVRDAYKVACLIERCGASEALTRASCAAFELCEALSDYARHSNELEELVEQFQDGHTPSEET